MAKTKVLITGISGMLGNNLAWHFKNRFDVYGTYLTHRVDLQGCTCFQLDLGDPSAVKRLIEKIDPQIVIHCASSTNLDLCETDPVLAKAANQDACRNLVLGLNSTTRLVHISTDAVYAGTKGSYQETDSAEPQNEYGRSKLAGEGLIRKFSNHLILRVNIFGLNLLDKKHLGEWAYAELKAGNKIKGFCDAKFSTIYSFILAEIIEQLMNKDLVGTFNCGASDSITKLEFLKLLAVECGFDPDLIEPISVEEFDFKAPRGKDLGMNCEHLERTTGIQLPTVVESIRRFCGDVKMGLPERIKAQNEITSSE